jgi:hypothetical protein
MPVKFLSAWPFLRERLSPSITRMNMRGDSGKPYLKALSLWKNTVDSPLIKMAKVAEDTHPMIQLVVGIPKPPWRCIKRRKSQFIQSYTFFKSRFRMMACNFLAFILCRHSWVVPIASKICLPF